MWMKKKEGDSFELTQIDSFDSFEDKRKGLSGSPQVNNKGTACIAMVLI